MYLTFLFSVIQVLNYLTHHTNAIGSNEYLSSAKSNSIERGLLPGEELSNNSENSEENDKDDLESDDDDSEPFDDGDDYDDDDMFSDDSFSPSDDNDDFYMYGTTREPDDGDNNNNLAFKEYEENSDRSQLPSDHDASVIDNEDSQPANNILPDDYDQIQDEVDMDEYIKECPTVCPARTLMVCARCVHKINKSFLSPCHLRMYACKHPEEGFELVNYKACVETAPALAEQPPAKGILSYPNDKDQILSYVICRENGKSSPYCVSQ